MALVLLNQGEAFILDLIRNAGLTLHLFSNNVTPSAEDTDIVYEEPVGGGYAPKVLLAGNWIITGGGPSLMEYPRQDFVFTGVPSPPTIYGYFVKSGSLVLWAEQGPVYVVQQATDEYRVVPRFTED